MKHREVVRRIDLDRLKEDLKHSSLKNNRELMEILREQPIIDNGSTVWIDERANIDSNQMKCAACGMRVYLMLNEPSYRFCPHCGRHVTYNARKGRNGRDQKP